MMFALGGGYTHERLTDVLHVHVQWLRHWKRREYAENVKTNPVRRARLHKTAAAWKAKARVTVAVARTCKVCRRQYTLTQLQLQHERQGRGKYKGCSKKCTLALSGRFELHEISGQVDTIRGWALRRGIPERTLYARIKRAGMSLAEAIAIPVGTIAPRRTSRRPPLHQGAA